MLWVPDLPNPHNHLQNNLHSFIQQLLTETSHVPGTVPSFGETCLEKVDWLLCSWRPR